MNRQRAPRLFARFAPAARSLPMPIPRHKRWADLEHRPINRRTGASPGGRRKNSSERFYRLRESANCFFY